jgi:hypothetical protein
MSANLSTGAAAADERLLERHDAAPRGTRSAEASELSAINAIMSVAMVGLLGGGPRLAMRAARLVLADTYGERSRAHGARPSGRIRHRG